MDFGANFSGTIDQQIIEQAALDCDLAKVAARKFDPQSVTVHPDELDRMKGAVRPIPKPVGQSKSMEDRPASRINAIATDFLPRKFLPLDYNDAQSGGGAERGAARSRGSAADNRNVEDFHRSSGVMECSSYANFFVSLESSNTRTAGWRAIQKRRDSAYELVNSHRADRRDSIANPRNLSFANHLAGSRFGELCHFC